MFALIVLFLLNVVAWIVTIILYTQYNPSLLSLALICWTFGLRHALDADHIVAIDNVTRQLVNIDLNSNLVGFFFSIGHCLVVCIVNLIAICTLAQLDFSEAQFYGGFIGTGVSAVFLLLISVFSFYSCYKLHRNNPGESASPQIGFLSKILSPLFKLIDRPWKMIILGFLFGLGFDTATEIILVTISASSILNNDPIWLTIMFPILFSLGMIFVDTLNGTVLLHVYTWKGLQHHQRQLFNFAITLFSGLMAFFISIIQFISFFIQAFDADIPGMEAIQDHFEWIGGAITISFLLAWVCTFLIHRYQNPKLQTIDKDEAVDV